jgi:polysaccharide biosynthesis protein PslG
LVPDLGPVHLAAHAEALLAGVHEVHGRQLSASGSSRLLRGIAVLAAAGAAVVAIVLASSGSGSEPEEVPRSFYGIVSQTPLTGEDFERMGEGGVGTLRIVLSWVAIEPVPGGGEFDFSSVDPLVLAAADEGIEVLPFFYGTPEWAAVELDGRGSCDGDCGPFAPQSQAALAAWGEFVGAAVDRYGPDGELWAENPDHPAQPIRTWQIWNEQNSATFFKPEPSIPQYVDLLEASERAIHEHDPGAEIVLGGMFGTPPDAGEQADTAWEYLRELYATEGVAELFDGVASHPYAANLTNVESQLELLRDELVSAGDSEAGLWVTELGWASSGPDHPLNRGPEGQAERLTEAFELLLDRRSEWNVEGVAWYSWRDARGPGLCDWCGGSGLFAEDSLEPKPSWDAYTEFTGGS